MADEREIESDSKLDEMKQHAQDLKVTHATRDSDAEDYEEMYLMKWDSATDPRFESMRVVTSPSARNAVEGAIRLMVATDPIWKVTSKTQKNTDLLEKSLTEIWDRAGRAAKTPIHYDLIRSALIWAEMVAAITPTAELVAHARKGGSKAQIAAAEALAEETPFLIEPWNPRYGYPDWDALGLASYYRAVEMTIGNIEARWGKLTTDKSRHDTTTLHVMYDREYCSVWTDDEALLCKPHEYSVIPIMAQLIDGSRLFPDPEDQRTPLLYGSKKSGMWDNENLVYTVLYTYVMAMGSVPKWLYVEPPSATDDPGPQFSWSSEIIRIRNGAQFAPVANKGIIDPALGEALQLATRVNQESTIFPQAFGSPAERNSTFSETNLLSQAGRLPLIGTQRKGGWAIGEIGRIMLMLMRDNTDYLKSTNLKASDIPTSLTVEAQLDIKLPQDKLQQANIARLLAEGDNPLVNQDWIRENILQIGQPGDIQKQIWDEKAANVLYQQRMMMLVQQAQEQAQQAQQPPQGPPPQGMPPQGNQPQGQPPEMGAGPGMAPGQGQAIRGMPPQMAGMVPGAGQGMVPEGEV